MPQQPQRLPQILEGLGSSMGHLIDFFQTPIPPFYPPPLRPYGSPGPFSFPQEPRMAEEPPFQLPGTPIDPLRSPPLFPAPPLPTNEAPAPGPPSRRTRVPKDEKKLTPAPKPLPPPLLPSVVTPTLLGGGGAAPTAPPLAPVPLRLEKTTRTPKSTPVLPPVVAPTALEPYLSPSLSAMRTKLKARGARQASLSSVPVPFEVGEASGRSNPKRNIPEQKAGGGSSRVEDDTETMSSALSLVPAARLPTVGVKPAKTGLKLGKTAASPSVWLSGAGGGSSLMRVEPRAPQGRASSGPVPAPVLLVPASQIGARTEKLKPESGYENGLPIAFRGDRGVRPVQGGKPELFFNPPALAAGGPEALALVPVAKGPKNRHLVDIRKHGNEAKKAKIEKAEGVEDALVPYAAPKKSKAGPAPEAAPPPVAASEGGGPALAPIPAPIAAPKGKKRSHDLDIRKHGNAQKKGRVEPAAAAPIPAAAIVPVPAAAALVAAPVAAPVAAEPLGRGHRLKKPKDSAKTGGKGDRFFPGSFDKGGRVKKTQLALVHKGEVVLTKKLARKLKDLITQ